MSKDQDKAPAPAPAQKGAQAPAEQKPAQTAEQEAIERQQARDAADLASAPQHVRDVAERLGGDVPRAAPKAGEGLRTTGTALAPAAPELEPAPPPAEFRAAPTSPGASERASWPSGGVSFEASQQLEQVRVRTKDPASAGIFVGSVHATRDGAVVNLSEVRARGEEHVRALLSDPRIEVAPVEAKKP